MAFKIIFTWLCLMILPGVFSAKILISTLYGEGSHFMAGAAVGEGLIERGHEVTFLIGRAFEHRATDPKFSNFSFLIFNHRHRSVQEIRDAIYEITTLAFKSAATQIFELMYLITVTLGDDCEGILLDVDLMKQLQGIDAIVMDPMWKCGVMVRTLLEGKMNHSKEIRLISLRPYITPPIVFGQLGSYYNPAVQPELSTGYSNRMTFSQRFINILFSGIQLSTFLLDIRAYQRVAGNTGLGQDIDLRFWAAHKLFDLHLMNMHFSSDFSIPLSPNIIFVGGGLTARPSTQLDQNLEEFIQSSGEEGVIVFTLGTYFASVTKFQPEFVDTFAEAFRKLPQKVIWQLKDHPEKKFPPNVITMPWVPQNDLLGHPKIRLFITHGGNNGFQEACYHGVPVVVVPFFADQFDVAARVESRGMGRKIDKATLTPDVIYETISDVINNPKYGVVVKEVASIIKDNPMSARERAAFWVEHVIKFGGEYLRSPAMELSFIQYYMLDVFALLLLMILGILVSAFAVVQFGVSLYSWGETTKSKKD